MQIYFNTQSIKQGIFDYGKHSNFWPSVVIIFSEK